MKTVCIYTWKLTPFATFPSLVLFLSSLLFSVQFLAKVIFPQQSSGLGAGSRLLSSTAWWACEHVFLGGRHQLAGAIFAYSAKCGRAELGMPGGACGRAERMGKLWSARGQAEQISKQMDRWQVVAGEGKNRKVAPNQQTQCRLRKGDQGLKREGKNLCY